MSERLFGLEREFALAPVHRSQELMKLARQLFPHLPDSNTGGIFFANGGLYYTDTGSHPEYASPEISNPWDAVRYMCAAESMLQSCVERMNQQPEMEYVQLFKHNVDYRNGTTWANHESYMYTCGLKTIQAPIIPHLVTRIIYCGAGGWNPLSSGLEFTLSPRSHHLKHTVSAETTSDRAILNTRQESLCRSTLSYHRLHLVCGESLCSDTAEWLKIATTALVVALCDIGCFPSKSIHLKNPLQALRRIAADPTCTARVKTAGGDLTAIEIQRHFLELAERNAGHDLMPPWTEEACQHWRLCLEKLERSPMELARTLDWPIKRAFYTNLLHQHGYSWEKLEAWNEAILFIQKKQRELNLDEGSLGHSTIQKILRKCEPEAVTVTRALHAAGCDWSKFQSLMTFRDGMFETEVRFSQLGDEGIFTQLDKAEVLEHHFAGVDNIAHAIEHPPSVGRAKIRGEIVRKLAGHNGRYECTWTRVSDNVTHRYIDLSNPLESCEEWQEPKERPVPTPSGPRPSSPNNFFESFRTARSPELTYPGLWSQALRAYDHGNYHECAQRISEAERCFSGPCPHELLHLKVWTLARSGDFRQGLGALNRRGLTEQISGKSIESILAACRFAGIVPSSEMDRWVDPAIDFLATDQTCADTIHDHLGNYYLATGQFLNALRYFERPTGSCSNLRVRARALCQAANIHRILGDRPNAAELLNEASRLQEHGSFDSEFSEFNLTNRAKLIAVAVPEDSLRLLEMARNKLSHLNHHMGLARVFLLEARLSPSPRVQERRKNALLEFRQQLPGLAECPRLQSILDDWDNWCRPTLSPDSNSDPFRGV